MSSEAADDDENDDESKLEMRSDDGRRGPSQHCCCCRGNDVVTNEFDGDATSSKDTNAMDCISNSDVIVGWRLEAQ